jgi:hypothetical protein
MSRRVAFVTGSARGIGRAIVDGSRRPTTSSVPTSSPPSPTRRADTFRPTCPTQPSAPASSTPSVTSMSS